MLQVRRYPNPPSEVSTETVEMGIERGLRIGTKGLEDEKYSADNQLDLMINIQDSKGNRGVSHDFRVSTSVTEWNQPPGYGSHEAGAGYQRNCPCHRSLPMGTDQKQEGKLLAMSFLSPSTDKAEHHNSWPRKRI